MSTRTLLIITILLIVGEPIIQFLLKRYYQNKILHFFQTDDLDALENLLNKTFMKYLFPPFNIEFCRLNEAFLRKNKKQIDRQFDILLTMKLNEAQKKDVVLNGFNYYLSENNKKRVDKFYKLSQELKDEDIKQNLRISYDILCNDGYAYLEDILETYENCKEEERYINEFLLSIMYKNKGELEKSEYYAQLADKHKGEFVLR